MLKRLAKDVAIYGGADLLFRATQFLAIPVYAHMLAVEDFALMALLATSTTLLGMLLNLGINNAVQRFYFDPEMSGDSRRVLVSGGIAQLTFAGALAVGSGAGLLLLFGDDIEQSYGITGTLAAIALATVLPEQLTQYMQDVVRLHFAPVRYLLISLVRNLFGVLIGLWLLVGWDMGVAGVLLGTLIGALAAVPLGLILIRRELVFRFSRDLVARTWRYGAPFVFTGAAFWIFGSLDRWMLLTLSNVTQVGLFSVAIKFAAIVAFVTYAFGRAWSPIAFKLFGEDPNYPEIFSRAFSLWFLLLALIGLAVSLFSAELFVLLTPEEYWPAAPILSIAVMGLVFDGTTQFTSLGIALARRTIFLTYGAWLAAAGNVALNLWLIPRFGATGAAVATLASYALLTAAFLFWSQRLHPIPLRVRHLLYSVAVVAAGVLVPPLMGGTDWFGPGAVAAKLVILAIAAGGGVAIGVVDPKLARLVTDRLGRRAPIQNAKG